MQSQARCDARSDKRRAKRWCWRLSHSCFTPHYSLLSDRCKGEILNLRNMSSPEVLMLLSVVSPVRNVVMWQASQTAKSRGNPGQAKTGRESLLMIFYFFSPLLCTCVCYAVIHLRERKRSHGRTWSDKSESQTTFCPLTDWLSSDVDLSETRRRFLSPWLMIFFCRYMSMLCCNVLISSEQIRHNNVLTAAMVTLKSSNASHYIVDTNETQVTERWGIRACITPAAVLMWCDSSWTG